MLRGCESVDRFSRKLVMNIMSIQDTTHHTFRFHTIGNNNTADLQNFEVMWTLTFRSKDDVEKGI